MIVFGFISFSGAFEKSPWVLDEMKADLLKLEKLYQIFAVLAINFAEKVPRPFFFSSMGTNPFNIQVESII